MQILMAAMTNGWLVKTAEGVLGHQTQEAVRGSDGHSESTFAAGITLIYVSKYVS